VRAYLEAIAAFNPDGATRFYPGSPAFIANALRADDMLLACELHPEDAETLRARFGKQANVHVHARDGWEALNALLPPPRSRGLVLIDPPYEEPDELERAARALGPALKRFGHGMFLWWRPLKSESALDRVDAEVKAQGARAMLRADLWVDAPSPQGRLSGSSLLVINPPYGLDAALREALPALVARLALGKAGWRVA
jgi:23S rRNA (adenine2030-N6)-methyltransferase